MYTRFGFRGPFVLSIVAAVFDAIGRLLVIERKDALLIAPDPVVSAASTTRDPSPPQPGASQAGFGDLSSQMEVSKEQATSPTTPENSKPNLSLLAVASKLIRSPRAAGAFALTLLYG